MFLYMYVCVLLSCLVPMETERRCGIPWTWSYRLVSLTVTMWVPRTEPQSPAKAASALNHQAISLVPAIGSLILRPLKVCKALKLDIVLLIFHVLSPLLKRYDCLQDTN